MLSSITGQPLSTWHETDIQNVDRIQIILIRFIIFNLTVSIQSVKCYYICGQCRECPPFHQVLSHQKCLQIITRLLAQTTLRNILGTKNLHEILSERDSISNSMQVLCPEVTQILDCLEGRIVPLPIVLWWKILVFKLRTSWDYVQSGFPVCSISFTSETWNKIPS